MASGQRVIFRAYIKCVYHNCLNTGQDNSMFRFPVHDPERLLLWIRNSGNVFLDSLTNEELRRRYICAAHFLPSCIYKRNIRTRLIGPAVPIHFQWVAPSAGTTSTQKTAPSDVETYDSTSAEVLEVKTPTKFYSRKGNTRICESRQSLKPSRSNSLEEQLTATPPSTPRLSCKELREPSKECTETNAAASASSEQPPAPRACNGCNKHIIGLRLVCVECDVTACGACDAAGAHAHHYVLRVPAHKPLGEAMQLLKALRREFGFDYSVEEEEPLVKVEMIKEEQTDPLELLEDTVTPEESIEPLDHVMEESIMLDTDIVKEETELELGKTSYMVEDCLVKVTPAVTSIVAQPTSMNTVATTIVQPTMTPIVTTPAQATITLDPSLGVPILVMPPLSVSTPPPLPATAGPSRSLTAPPAAGIVASRFDVFSHNTTRAKKRKPEAGKSK